MPFILTTHKEYFWWSGGHRSAAIQLTASFVSLSSLSLYPFLQFLSHKLLLYYGRGIERVFCVFIAYFPETRRHHHRQKNSSLPTQKAIDLKLIKMFGGGWRILSQWNCWYCESFRSPNFDKSHNIRQ